MRGRATPVTVDSVESMRILILGGTVFLGHAFVDDALRRGYTVDIFHRGKSGTATPGARSILGDRDNPDDLLHLAIAGPWDAIIDTSGQHPHSVKSSALALSGKARVYLLISSIHSYQDWPATPINEDSSPRLCSPDLPRDEGEGNALKAGCERAIETYFTGDTLILQPGIIVGPRENRGRVTWWLSRAKRGGDLLAPGDPKRHIQLIDARDIAQFGLDLLERSVTGHFIVTGPHDQHTYRDFLEKCVRVTHSDAQIQWVNDSFLLEHAVQPWTELPLWAPGLDMRYAWDVSPHKAVTAALRCRPLSQTVEDTWQWMCNHGTTTFSPKEETLGIGLSLDKEQAILDAWNSRTPT